MGNGRNAGRIDYYEKEKHYAVGYYDSPGSRAFSHQKSTLGVAESSIS